MHTRLSPSALTQAIKAICVSEPVLAAYLFGSYARAAADEESDLDIAVLANSSLSKNDRFDLRLRLSSGVAQALGLPLEKIDIVILDDVPVLLQYNVIRSGKLLFAIDPAVPIRYAVRTEQQYEDEATHLDREADTTIDRILAHRV